MVIYNEARPTYWGPRLQQVIFLPPYNIGGGGGGRPGHDFHAVIHIWGEKDVYDTLLKNERWTIQHQFLPTKRRH
jgi:hypothetical protein